MDDCPVSVGDLLADKYRVERILGQGGMGVVVAAWHVELEQRVAVKFLLPQFAQDKAAAERFRREARAAVKIRSEHVARVIDVGTMEEGSPYMVMEYLEGKDLQTELERAGCFEIAEAVEYVLQACLAMAEAHAKGMIHRDLKPANLFRTTRPDGSHVIKVLDFGISKSIQGSSDPQLSLTRTAAMIGSPLYMSPEQLESARDVDERADVWSLGVILFELLTGSLPFGGDTLPQLVRSVLVGQHPKAHELRPEIPAGLSDVVSRCIKKHKDERFRNVGELAQALAAFLPDGERYSDRVQRVLTLSALPSAATAPIAAASAVSGPGAGPYQPASAGVSGVPARSGMPGSGVPGSAVSGAGVVASSAAGGAGEAPATDVDPPQFDRSRFDPSQVDPPRLDRSGATVEVRVSDSGEPGPRNKTVASWGGSNAGETAAAKKRFPVAAVAIAASVCVLGIGAWVVFAGPAAEAQLSDAEPAEELGQAAAAEAAGAQPEAVPTEQLAGENASAEPSIEPKVEPAEADGPEEAASSDGEGEDSEAARAAQAVATGDEADETSASEQPAARPVVNRPRPRPVQKPKTKEPPKPTDFTDFGGRR